MSPKESNNRQRVGRDVAHRKSEVPKEQCFGLHSRYPDPPPVWNNFDRAEQMTLSNDQRDEIEDSGIGSDLVWKAA